MSHPSKLIALVFDEEQNEAFLFGMTGQSTSYAQSAPDIAESVLKTIKQRAKEANVKLEDAVVLFKGHDGQIKIKQTKDITSGKGAKWGSFWGLMAGLMLGGPLGGLLWGLGIGAVYGAKVDHGIDDKFLKNVAASLTRTSSAVLMLVHAEDYTPQAQAYLESFGGKLHVADFDADSRRAVEAVAENKAVAEAVEAQFGEASAN